MKRIMQILILVSFAVGYADEDPPVAEDRTFSTQFEKVQTYIKENGLVLSKETFKEQTASDLISALLTLDEGTHRDFLEKGKENVTVVRDLKKYTAIILNPVIEDKKVLYPLLFGDVSDIKNLKGIILYTGTDGSIAYVKVYRKITPKFLVDLIDDSFFPDESVIKMEMIDKKSNGRETAFGFTIHSVRNVASVMEFTSPRREEGKKMLLKDNTIWMYSPRVSRPIRLNNRQKFMGSSFSNNDLLDTSMSDDYNITIEGMEEIEGSQTIKLLLIAKNKHVTYPKMVIWLRTDNLVAMRLDYYTPSGKVLKRMVTKKLQLLGGRERASELVMTNLFEKGAETIVRINEIKVTKVPKKIFTESYLKR